MNPRIDDLREDSAAELLESAMQLIQSDKHSEAEELLLPLYNSFADEKHLPDSIMATTAHLLGVCALDAEHSDAAKKYLKIAFTSYLQLPEKSLESISSLVNCALDLAECHLDDNDSAEAMTCLTLLEKEILRKLPRSDDAALNATISNIYLLLAEHSECDATIQEAYLATSLQYNPDNVASSIKKATLDIDQKKYLAARDLLLNLKSNTAWDDEPALLGDCLYHLARCELHFGRYKQAEAYLTDALDIYQATQNYPSVSACYLGLGLINHHRTKIKDGNHFLHEALAFFQQLESASAVQEANDIILDWCSLANFPGSFRIHGPQQTILARLLVRINELNTESVLTDCKATLYAPPSPTNTVMTKKMDNEHGKDGKSANNNQP